MECLLDHKVLYNNVYTIIKGLKIEEERTNKLYIIYPKGVDR